MTFKIRDAHWETMIAFFENNRELATGRLNCPNAKERAKQLWGELSAKLNSLGYGERSSDKWQKTWTDLKYLIKKKGAALTRDQAATGGGHLESTPFNKYELRVLNILGTTFYQGVGEAENAKDTKNTVGGVQATEKIQFRDEPGPSTSGVGAVGPSKHKKTAAADHDYSVGPSSKRKKIGIEDAYMETLTVLREMKDVVNNRLTEINTTLKEIRDELKK